MSSDDIEDLWHSLCVPRAALIFHRKRRYDDGAALELKLGQAPAAVPGSAHLFKYSLFHGKGGERLVGYDNEAGKGDHRHYSDKEEAYAFTPFRQMLVDFLDDVRQPRRGPGYERGHEDRRWRHG